MTPRGSNPVTRDRLIAAAISLALSRGFNATSVDEICSTANLTKGAFFHYFASKEGLGQAILDRWVSDGSRAYGAAPFWNYNDPLDRVIGYVDFTIELTKTGPLGCLVGVMSQELWQSHPQIRLNCGIAFSDWAEGLGQLIKEAKELHAPSASFDPVALAYHFIAVFEGSLILARALGRADVVEEQLVHFTLYLQSLFGQDRTRGVSTLGDPGSERPTPSSNG